MTLKTVVLYEASDGTHFNTKVECIMHERWINLSLKYSHLLPQEEAERGAALTFLANLTSNHYTIKQEIIKEEDI